MREMRNGSNISLFCCLVSINQSINQSIKHSGDKITHSFELQMFFPFRLLDRRALLKSLVNQSKICITIYILKAFSFRTRGRG